VDLRGGVWNAILGGFVRWILECYFWLIFEVDFGMRF